eukprot:2013260-Rhodomonas_salina.2
MLRGFPSVYVAYMRDILKVKVAFPPPDAGQTSSNVRFAMPCPVPALVLSCGMLLRLSCTDVRYAGTGRAGQGEYEEAGPGSQYGGDAQRGERFSC